MRNNPLSFIDISRTIGGPNVIVYQPSILAVLYTICILMLLIISFRCFSLDLFPMH